MPPVRPNPAVIDALKVAQDRKRADAAVRKIHEQRERERNGVPYDGTYDSMAAGKQLAVPNIIDVITLPEPEPINGAELLTDTARLMGTYVAFPSLNAHVIAVLWNVSALARDRDEGGIGPLIWPAHARLGVTSKRNKSGKTTLLDASRGLQQTSRPGRITGRALAHKLGKSHKALVLDETKLLFGTGLANQDVQSILVNGYTRGATWEITSGNHELEIPCYGAVVYAAKDDLITSTQDRLTDLFDRTIWIRMERPTSLRPQMDDMADADFALVNQSLIMWTDAMKDDLLARHRELAKQDYQRSLEAAQEGREIDARRPQIWRPLLAVADVAGGPWPILARRAMNEVHDEAIASQRAIHVRAGERWAEFDIDEEVPA